MIAKRLFARPGVVFSIVFLWKAVLLVLFILPVPSNDSFFYDGPAVNYLLHGRYANPALAPALPISGTELFCAYQPLYGAVLTGWMRVFGTSIVSAMALHLVLFGAYMLVLLAIFRRLKTPPWAINVAGLFLLLITFHDRPDTLAHLFGIAAVYAWVRSRRALAGSAGASGGWGWAMAGFAILSLATGLQIGALYSLFLWVGMLACRFFAREPFPIAPMTVMVAVPAGLIALVAFRFPHLWAGFLEHAHQTPALTGWRLPGPEDVLKAVRNAPGILAAAALLPWLYAGYRANCQKANRLSSERPGAPAPLPARRGLAEPAGKDASAPSVGKDDPSTETGRFWLVTVTATLATLAIVGAALCLITPNSVLFVGQLQPLIVGGCLALAATMGPARGRLRALTWLFMALAAVGSIRAAGLTTWGAACAVKNSYSSARNRIQSELRDCARGSTVVLSAAYLYEAARHQEVRWIHSDWMAPARRYGPSPDWEGLTTLKPAKILLTQFDYYRRYEPLLAQLRAEPDLATVEVINTAQVPAPDSIRPLRKVVQHISWAPVVVKLEWK